MTLILNLPPAVEQHLNSEAKRKGLSVEDYALSRLAESTPSEPEGAVSSGEYVLKLVQEFKDSLPEEEWKGLPPDFATKYKDYLRAQQARDAE